MTFVIVGAGQAAAWACRTLRSEGYDGRLVLVGEEPLAPYERPPLSKEFLQGKQTAEKPVLKPEWYPANGVELRLGRRATRIRDADRVLVLDDGEELAYDRLLLCTGARPRRFPDAPGVHYLRTLEDASGLARAMRSGRRIAIVGAGFIGLEVAATARRLGLETLVVDPLEIPLLPIVGREVGQFIADVHRAEGVDLRLGERVTRLDGSKVVTDAGAYEADVVAAGIGVVPNVELAEGTGIVVDNGFVVDENCRTSVPEIFAAGDVASYPHPVLGERLRIEHWQNANAQGVVAARGMLGIAARVEDLPWFWTDQYDLNVQMVGHARRWDRVVLRGTGRTFSAWYLEHGRVKMTLAVNRFKDLRPARELIRSGAAVSAEALADESVDLKSL